MKMFSLCGGVLKFFSIIPVSKPNGTFALLSGLVWGEHDYPSAESSCEGPRSKPHCGWHCG